MSDIEKIKQLRQSTGAGFKDCNAAIKESIKLNIPIIAILDTNSDPIGINFPIPGNDDARRSIDLYCNLIKETIVNAKKNATVNNQEKQEIGDKKKTDKPKPLDKKKTDKIKTLKDIDREKLEAKFAKKKSKLN